MNRPAIITAFLGRMKNNYVADQKNRSLEEILTIEECIERLNGMERCCSVDAEQVPVLRALHVKIAYPGSAGCPRPASIQRAVHEVGYE